MQLNKCEKDQLPVFCGGLAKGMKNGLCLLVSESKFSSTDLIIPPRRYLLNPKLFEALASVKCIKLD